MFARKNISVRTLWQTNILESLQNQMFCVWFACSFLFSWTHGRKSIHPIHTKLSSHYCMLSLCYALQWVPKNKTDTIRMVISSHNKTFSFSLPGSAVLSIEKNTFPAIFRKPSNSPKKTHQKHETTKNQHTKSKQIKENVVDKVKVFQNRCIPTKVQHFLHNANLENVKSYLRRRVTAKCPQTSQNLRPLA